MSALETLPVGIVVERREIDNRWAQYEWHPVAVIPGAPALDDEAEWRLLREGEGWRHFLIGNLDIELFRRETDGYRVNLANTPPHVYVVLSEGEEADDPDIMPFLVTVCPYEAESYTEGDGEICEGVPMPDEIAAWVQAFVDEHHVEVAFKKRKNKPYDPRKGGFGRGGRASADGRPPRRRGDA